LIALDLGQIEAKFGLLIRDKFDHDNYVLLELDGQDHIIQYYDEFKKQISSKNQSEKNELY